MASVTYYTASGQSAYNVATTIGYPVWLDVIPELASKLVFLQPFMQLAVSYSPLALNTVYPEQGSYGVPATPTYYLVGEEGFSDERAGLIKWNRKFARVPGSWSDTQEFAYQYPGYVVPITIGAAAPITSITAGGSTTYYQVSTTLVAVTAGDQVYISCSYVRSSATYAIAFFTRAVTNSNGTVIGIPFMLPGTGDFTSEGGTIQLASAGRAAAKSMVVPSRILNDYALSTAETLETDLPLIDGFKSIDVYGNELSVLLTGTASKPNSESYAKWLAANAEIVAETSNRARWMGNIFVRQTRMVPAK